MEENSHFLQKINHQAETTSSEVLSNNWQMNNNEAMTAVSEAITNPSVHYGNAPIGANVSKMTDGLSEMRSDLQTTWISRKN